MPFRGDSRDGADGTLHGSMKTGSAVTVRGKAPEISTGGPAFRAGRRLSPHADFRPGRQVACIVWSRVRSAWSMCNRKRQRATPVNERLRA